MIPFIVVIRAEEARDTSKLKRHEDLALATDEARRLAAKEDDEFYVLVPVRRIRCRRSFVVTDIKP